MLKLIVPMFVVACVSTLVIDAFLLLSGQLKQTTTLTTPLIQMLGITLGIAFGIILSIALGVIFGITLSIALGVIFG
ncbi:MAG TPA: hypothetical protein VKX46_00100, partial [Ktedonobacteraceae bacterium]|nr:hypothetical protein [Ktedonobacteraceae bacterium]